MSSIHAHVRRPVVVQDDVLRGTRIDRQQVMDLETLPEPTDEESFRKALETVIETARQNGIDVERDWACQPESVRSDWAVDIVRLASTETTDDCGHND